RTEGPEEFRRAIASWDETRPPASALTTAPGSRQRCIIAQILSRRFRMADLTRRAFVLGSGNLLAAGAAALSIGPARADQVAVSPGLVRLRPEIEPVVRWIETTPRERILDVAVEEMRKGLPYRDLLAATFLAGVRNVKPRPVGFKFHTVLVMNSAH